jgi:hypothetical protein
MCCARGSDVRRVVGCVRVGYRFGKRRVTLLPWNPSLIRNCDTYIPLFLADMRRERERDSFLEATVISFLEQMY